jgi:putative DNA methylase
LSDIRPGKYIEYDFPLHEVNRLAVKEANAKKPIYTMHKWWARRLSCVFRTILLASAIDWEDWDRLEPWQRDDDGDFVDDHDKKLTDEREYHRRVRKETKNSAWERLYYRLDDEANAVIRWSFTKPIGEPKDKERLAVHLAELGVSPEDKQWWEAIDWETREPITVLDPFMGGGTTVVESLRLGANVVGVDLNPVAWFVVKKETDGCDLDALQEAFEQVEADVAEEIKQYYRTTCPCCGEQADVMYYFWVKLAKCQERTCGATVPLYNSFVLAKMPVIGKDRDVPRNKHGKAAMMLEAGSWRSIQFVKCPAPECGIIYGSKRKPSENESTCPACGLTFDPTEGYAGRGKYTCQECGSEHEILEAAKQNISEGIDRNMRLTHHMHAMEIFCPHCDYKAYKAAEEADQRLFKRASCDLQEHYDDLRIPDQQIPHHGVNTNYAGNDLWAHGYRYWREMFNDRQLLCLCRLRDAILRLGNQNLREYLLLAWSDSIRNQNLFCGYERDYRKLSPQFSLHAYRPNLDITENNVWGTDFGRGTFINIRDQLTAAFKWLRQPDDNFFSSDDSYSKRKIGDGFTTSGDRADLHAQSSEHLSNITPAICQHAITDPPYYGNVMYSELADFFYVWLRTALEDEYPEQFGAHLTPKEEEVIENAHWAPSSGSRTEASQYLTKDEAFFTTGLTRIFQETSRHVEDDGVMVFTFHHQANEAWASVLRTVLNADFNVTAVIPVHAEMTSSYHIADKANISYDAVIVCRKQTEAPKEVQWVDVTDQIYLKAERLVRELEEKLNPLASEDIYVVAIGKCMEEYSQHYYRGESFVKHQGKPVGIDEALNGNPTRGIRGIGQIVDELVEEAEGRMWPAGLDPVSRFYVINFLGQTEVPWDRLQRRIVHNPQVDLKKLQDLHLVQEKGGKVKVIPEMDRADYLLERYHNADGPQRTLIEAEDPYGLNYIDRLHLIYAMDRKGLLTAGLIEEWRSDTTFVDLARDIVEYLDPKDSSYAVYKRIAEALVGQGALQMNKDSLM